MPTNAPRCPVGSGNDGNFFRRVWQALWGPENQLRSTDTVRVDRRNNGIFLHALISGASLLGIFWTKGARLYDKTKSWKKDQVVYIPAFDPMCTAGTTDPDTMQNVKATPGLWIALQNVAPVVKSGVTYYRIPQSPQPTPNNPDDIKNYWWPWGGGSSGPTQIQYKIVTINPDYLVCHTYYNDGTAHEGTQAINIAKVQESRTSVNYRNDTIDGVAYTYTYIDDNTRTSKDSANNTQIEVCHRRYVVGGIIKAESCDHTGVFVAGSELTLEEVKPVRVWARRYAQ